MNLVVSGVAGFWIRKQGRILVRGVSGGGQSGKGHAHAFGHPMVMCCLKGALGLAVRPVTDLALCVPTLSNLQGPE